MPYRAVIVDFDRTLLRPDKTISDRSLRALRDWRAAGARLFAATARPERAITAYREAVAFDAVTTPPLSFSTLLLDTAKLQYAAG